MPELPPAAAAFATIENPEETLGAMAPVPRIHDATYLTAVLPFALGQARRHAETLSVLCIEVDRRAGIAELLGNDRAEHALQDAGKQIAAQIRSSDFVCRLDDGRLLAVLPRASLQDASKIARKLCDDVKRNSENLPEVGGVTVSIGVAEFPACAENVFALFDAADDALGEAKRRGRNQAHAAPARRPEDRLQSA